MSWIQKLCETYDNCRSSVDPAALWPIAHVAKKAHIEVAIDGRGNFLKQRARKLEWQEAVTLIPATESSAGRTSGAAPHPLCEELSYCALDLPDRDDDRQVGYVAQLEAWASSAQGHPKVSAVLSYVRKGTLWGDLQSERLLPLVTVGPKGTKTKVADSKVFIRWRVEQGPGEVRTGSWEDPSLHEAWAAFDNQQNQSTGICMITGRLARSAKNHPRFIRSSDDGAKLISANDFEGFTFRGRFTDSKQGRGSQGCDVSFEVSQKAHNALRWLIQRQAYRDYETGQTFVSWSVGGAAVPDPLADSWSLLGIAAADGPVDTDQAFAIRLAKAIAGYGSQLRPNDDVVVMGLDSATPGRLAITYNREIKGSEFLRRVENWHATAAWFQNFGRDRCFVGAPAPRDIAEAAFGQEIDARHRKAVVERLLPCVVDGLPVPADLVNSAVRRTSNRVGLGRWEFEKSLGVACALYRKVHSEREYQMSLEPDRTTRDYLYGRLLALADHLEGRALWVGGEKTRETAAARLMQRFSDRPFSTWRTIEISLAPYRARLKANRGRFLHELDKTLDGVMGLFQADDFKRDSPLSGEFLLGYHCQRRDLRPSEGDEALAEEVETTETPATTATPRN